MAKKAYVAYENRDNRLSSKTEYVVLFRKVDHSDLVLLGMTWSDKVRALMKLQRARAYET